MLMVTGRTATLDEQCGIHLDGTPAVSTFMIDGRKFASACERHIIETYRLAEIAVTPDTYVRGTKTGRVNLTHVPTGTRVLVNELEGGLVPAVRKTGALIATVLGKRKGGGFRCYTLTTDLGDIVAPAAMCMHTVPTTPAS